MHNVRIERLWVDVTAQIGETWANFFVALEIHHGLDINNTNHIWLLHYLFLPFINEDLTFFAESWNEHQIQIRGGPNRSPADMFNFDMVANGIRGDLLDTMMSHEELEVYGIDWEGLREDHLLHSQQCNNSIDEEGSLWIGHAGPPPHLNEVLLEDPDVSVNGNELGQMLLEAIGEGSISDEESRINLWINGLACARQLNGHSF